MRKTRKFRWDRLALCVWYVCSIAFVVWIALSYFNVVLHNTEVNPEYVTWNFFRILF